MRALRLVSVAVLIAIAGCNHILGFKDPVAGDGGTVGDSGDARADGSSDAGSNCYGVGLVKVCLAQPPTQDLHVMTGTQTITTDPTSISCATNVISGGTGYCVVAFQNVTIDAGAQLVATGARPLVIVAAGSATIAGTLDAASHRNGAQGPDSNYGGCTNGTNPGANGGGAGGSFGSKGGNGGAPNASTSGAVLPAPTALHGGCSGEDGAGLNAGNGGDGGGAVYLIAGTLITVSATGRINASGAGAERPQQVGSDGGSGGGSGGMIGLDAPTINIAGVVFANGGGGSEGATSSSLGTNGGDPINGAAGTGGSGGGGGGDAGDGAAGTANGSTGSDGSAGVAGGGGGGGGVGVLKLYGTRTGTGTLSPPAS